MFQMLIEIFFNNYFNIYCPTYTDLGTKQYFYDT